MQKKQANLVQKKLQRFIFILFLILIVHITNYAQMYEVNDIKKYQTQITNEMLCVNCINNYDSCDTEFLISVTETLNKNIDFFNKIDIKADTNLKDYIGAVYINMLSDYCNSFFKIRDLFSFWPNVLNKRQLEKLSFLTLLELFPQRKGSNYLGTGKRLVNNICEFTTCEIEIGNCGYTIDSLTNDNFEDYYPKLFNRFKSMSNNEFNPINVKAFLPEFKQKIIISFDYNNSHYEWNYNFGEETKKIITQINELLAEKSQYRFFYFNQSFLNKRLKKVYDKNSYLIGCLPLDNIKKLNKRINVKIF